MNEEYTPSTRAIRETLAQGGITFGEFSRWLIQERRIAWNGAVDALDRHYGDLRTGEKAVKFLEEANPYRG